MNREKTVYIGVGSNLGNKYENIRQARNLLHESSGVSVLKVSDLYTTEPFGNVPQEDFLNCVFKIETSLNPEELLAFLNNVESALKRERTIHWGPRTLDLDILFYDDLVIKTKKLTIPHPGIEKRLFVLIPLNDLIPDYIHPVLKKTCKALEAELRSIDNSAVAPSGLFL